MCKDCHHQSPDLRLVVSAQVRIEQERAQPSTTKQWRTDPHSQLRSHLMIIGARSGMVTQASLGARFIDVSEDLTSSRPVTHGKRFCRVASCLQSAIDRRGQVADASPDL